MSEWKKVKIGEFLTESKVLAEESDAAHRITVRLNCKGVEKRGLKAEKEGATKYYTRYTGQFIYGKQNIHKGAFGIIPSELDGFTSSADLPAFDIDESKCVPEWIPLCLKVDERYKTLQKEVKGVGSQRLAVNVFLNVEIPLPEVSVQRKILAKVGKKITSIALLDDEIEKQKSYAKQLRQNILQDAIEGKLTEDWRKKHPLKKGDPDYDAEALFEQIQNEKYHTDLFAPNSAHVKKAKSVSSEPIRVTKKDKSLPPITKDEIPFEIPTGWKWVRLGEICFNIEGGKSILCKEIVPNKNEIGIVKTGVCSFGYFKEDECKTCLSPKDWHDEYAIHKGDFLIGRANTLELVGSCVIVDKIERKLMLSDKILRINFDEMICSDFVLCAMKSKYVREQIERSATGASPTMKNISQESIRNYSLPLPALAEQKEIVTRVEAELQTIAQLETQIATREAIIKQLMQSILKNAFEE